MAMGGVAGPRLISGCASLANLSRTSVEGVIREDGIHVPLSAFSRSDREFEYIIVHNQQLKFPICVYKYPDDSYEALWMECTHQGAELQVFGNKLECPAHGSEFNQTGEVLNGPADTNLKKFPTQISGRNLLIQLL